MADIAQVAHPTLYGAPDGGLVIYGQKCLACGHLSHPRQPYGCETCGGHGDSLAPLDLVPHGELVSFAVVHRHHGRDIEAPFVMAEVRLDAGPLLRVTLTSRDETGLSVGQAMEGVLHRDDAGDRPAALCFRPVEA